MKVAVGGTYQDYLRWRNDAGLAPLDAIFVGDDPNRLMGLEIKEGDVVYLGYISQETEYILRTRFR